MTVYAGSTTTLKVTGTNKKVTWSTSNKKIATVNGKGKVTAKKAGKATISAKVSGKKYSCKVTVKTPYLNATKKTLTEGETYKFKLTGTTAKKWTSSKASVATVSSKGTVKAKKAGKATIICTGKDKKKYKCVVTVKEKHVHEYSEKIIKSATCTASGVKRYTCAGCGATKDETIPQLSHSFSHNTVAPTCTTEGYTEYKCTLCGYKYLQDKKSALGHDYQSTETATCISSGYLIKQCKTCGYETRSVLAAQPDKHNYETKTVSPTCTEKGYTLHECIYCKDSYKTDYVDAKGHTKGTLSRTVAASKNSQGYDIYKCTDCDYEYYDNYTDWVPDEQQVYEDMIALQGTYPEGTEWTNDNYYAWNGGIYSGGYGCAGFAFLLSDAAFGCLPARIHTDTTNIRVGDIVRINNDSHSVMVLRIEGDIMYTAEGNFNKSIRWNYARSLDSISITYIMTRYPE